MHTAMINTTLTIFKFFSKDRTPPRIPTQLLQSPFQLPMDLGNLCHYFPGRALEVPSNTLVMMYIGHTIDFTTLSARVNNWLCTCIMTWNTTPIQSEHAMDLCWFVYSIKNTNCHDLGTALTTLLGKTVSLQFQMIQTGPPQKPLALAVHLLADEADAIPIMLQLNDIYSKD